MALHEASLMAVARLWGCGVSEGSGNCRRCWQKVVCGGEEITAPNSATCTCEEEDLVFEVVCHFVGVLCTDVKTVGMRN